MNRCLMFVCPLILASVAIAGVNVSAPSNDSTVSSPVHYEATAGSTSCSKGVASMGIYTAPGELAYTVNGTSLSTDLKLSAGTYNTTVEQWDHCGGAATKAIKITVSNSSGISVTAPASGSNVSSPVHYSATATTSCSKGVASMGIYTAPGQKAYVVSGAKLDTDLTLSAGTYNTTVEEWDNCGGAATTPITITVGGNSFSKLQTKGGWVGYGELPPKYDICTKCSGVTWSMSQKQSSPSMSGSSTKFFIGGTTPYADVLWNNHLIGDGSSQGMLDGDHKIIPTIHNLTYDAYFYGTDLTLVENIEFDLAQFFDDLGFMFGTECRIQGDKQWAIWDNVEAQWISTGIACSPVSKSWNHVTIEFERTSGNQLKYKTITLNGKTDTLNWTYNPFSAPGWYGLVVNFQLDGNYKQSDYSIYVDNMTISYY